MAASGQGQAVAAMAVDSSEAMLASPPLPTRTASGFTRPLKKAAVTHMAKPVTAQAVDMTAAETTNSVTAQTIEPTVIQRTTYSLAGQAIAVRVRELDDGGVELDNNLYYLHNDHASTLLSTGLGSVSAMSDVNGNLVPDSTARYTPFGDWRTEPGTNPALTDRGYTGHKSNNSGTNDLGLIYMNARYYVSGIGRFASADTIVPDPANPQSFNRFSYTYNNPMRLIDPSGHYATNVKGALYGCQGTGDCQWQAQHIAPMPSPDLSPLNDWLSKQNVRWETIKNQGIHLADQIALFFGDVTLNSASLTGDAWTGYELGPGLGSDPSSLDFLDKFGKAISVADLGMDELEVLAILFAIDSYQQENNLTLAELDYLNMRAVTQANTSVGLFFTEMAVPIIGVGTAGWDTYAAFSQKLQTNELMAKEHTEMVLATNVSGFVFDRAPQARYDSRISGPIASEAARISDEMIAGERWWFR